MPQGLPAKGSGSRPPFAWSSETFGSYKVRRGAGICLHNYSDFLLSETVDWATRRRPGTTVVTGQAWHVRLDADPAHRWLRRALARVARDVNGG